MAAPQQPRPVTVVTSLGLKSDLNMHRAHRGSFRVRIEARHEWVEPGDFGKLVFERSAHPRSQQTTGIGMWTIQEREMHISYETKWPAAARNLIPLSRFPQGERRGADGSPHAAHDARQPNPLARIAAAAPPARGVSKRSAEPPLARSPRAGPRRCAASRWSARSQDDRTWGRTKDGRHVVLDFYDLLIEPIMILNAVHE